MGRGDDILAELKRGKYDGKALDVSEYIKSSATAAASSLKFYCNHAQNFLYVFTVNFEKLPSSEVSHVLQASLDCAHLLKKHSTNPKDFHSAAKLLYHVLNKALKVESVLECLSIAGILLDLLMIGDQDETSVQMVARSSYTVLWNGAIREERNTHPDLNLSLQLRFLALSFLLLSNNGAEKGFEAVPWSIDHYAHAFTKQKHTSKKQLQESKDLMQRYINDLSEIILYRTEQNGTDEKDMELFRILDFEIHLHFLSFILQLEAILGERSRENEVMNKHLLQGCIDKIKLNSDLSKSIQSLIDVGVYISRLPSSADEKKKNVNFSPAEVLLNLEKTARFLSSSPPAMLSLPLAHLVHSAVHFCLKLPQEGTPTNGKVPKITAEKSSEKILSALIDLHRSAGKFYMNVSKSNSKVTTGSKMLSEMRSGRWKILLYQLTHTLHLIDGSKGWSDEKTLKIVNDAKSNISLLGGMNNPETSKDNPTALEDLYYLANLSHRVGRLCFVRGLYKEGEDFLQSCLTQSKSWMKATPTDKRTTMSMWKKYELLGECQRKGGLLEKALTTIAEGISQEDSDCLKYATEAWVKIKMDMVKVDEGQLDTRSLWSCIRKTARSLTAEEVLSAELYTYKQILSRRRCYELMYVVIDELLAVNKADPVKHALTLLDKAQVLWLGRKDDNMSPAACAESAIELLERAVTEHQTTPNAYLYDVTARAYLWLHLVSFIDPIQVKDMMTKKKSSSTLETEKSGMESVDVMEGGEDNEVYHDCCTIDMELLSARSADKALQLWEKAVNCQPSNPPGKQLQSLTSTLTNLASLTDYYRLTHRVVEEYRSLSVRLKLVRSVSRHQVIQYIQVETGLMELYSRLNQPHLALPIITRLEHTLDEQEEEDERGSRSHENNLHYIMYLLAKAEVLLLDGKVGESCETVHQAMVLRGEHFKVRTSESLMITSRIYRMVSRLIKLPRDYHVPHATCCLTLQDVVGTSLELVNQSAKLISGVICYLMGDWLISRKAVIGNVPPNTMRKWSLLDELLTTLVYTGATYVEFGEALEASCHLRQGLKLAQAFHLPRRFAEFHLELCNLNNKSDKSSESQSHLNISSYVLNPLVNPHPSTPDDPMTTPQKTKPTLIQQNPDESSDSDIEEITIKTKVMEIPGMMEGENLIGSPAVKKWKPSLPLSWLHETSCHCTTCCDVSVQDLLLKHALQQAMCFYQQGLKYQAEASWQMLLDNFHPITNKVQQALVSIVESPPPQKKLKPKATSGGSRRKKDAIEIFTDEPAKTGVKPVMYQGVLVDASLSFTELSLCDQKWEAYEEWLDKVEDLLDTCKYPWMLEKHTSLAKVYYLRMVPALPWPSVVEKTDLEELCERIGGSKLTRQTSETKVVNPEPSHDIPTKTDTSTKIEDVPIKKPLKPKLTAKKTNSKTKCVPCETKSEVVSPIPAVPKTKAAPLQRKKTAKKASPEMGTEGTKQVYKTPARPTRIKMNAVNPLNTISSPSMENKVPEYMNMFRTPRNVSSRRAQLDLLIISDDDDDDFLPPTKKTTTKTLTAKRTSRKKTTLATPPKKLDILSPSYTNKLTAKTSVAKEDIKFATPKGKSPICRLVKSSLKRDVAMEMNNENVYDFIPSSPEETAARGKKKPGKPGRKPAALKPKRTAKQADEIEMVREKDRHENMDGGDGEVIVVRDDSPEGRDPVKKQNKKIVNSKVVTKMSPLMKKLTRSRTAKLETYRADDHSPSPDHNSLSLSFDLTHFVPEADEVEDEGGDSLGIVSPDRRGLDDSGLFSSQILTDDFIKTAEKLEQLDLLSEPIETPRSDDMVQDLKGRKRVSRKGGRKAEGGVDDEEATTEKPRLSRVMQSRGCEPRTTQSPDANSDESSLVRMTRAVNLNSDLEERLEKAFCMLRHLPTLLPYRQVCHAKVLLELSRPSPDPWTLAFYLTESHSVAFRHSALANIDRKLKKLSEGSEGEDVKDPIPRLEQMRTTLSFGSSQDTLRQLVDTLPHDWTVVQMGVLTAVGEPRGRLILTRFTAGKQPVIIQLPGYSVTQGQKLLGDFSDILKTNNATMGITNRSEWWSQRLSLDEKMKETLESIENRWFGCWVGALQGRPDHDDDEDKLERAGHKLSTYIQQKTSTPVNTQLVKLMLRNHHILSELQVREALSQICGSEVDEDVISEIIAKTNGVGKSLNLALSTSSRPVILILDREIQHLPLESIPTLRGQPISRIPSLHFLCGHLQAHREDPDSVYNTGVDTRRTFYILNPDNNLDRTQADFATRFQSEEGWDGISARAPTSQEFSKAITEYDQFIYCGHGSGSKFLSGTTLASLRCRSLVVLMGCSSGRLRVEGQLEATGIMLHYFLAGCPSIVACLWDVTDRDIDRCTGEILRRWLQPNQRESILHCVHQSAGVCRMPYLIGAAPAVYGLPVYTKHS